ncbi:UNVERIFIED_CONTAM: hypothetical protein PYX00_010154 [Menopon gallinae]|uniref:Uncharacterized protein n=1 Tax=Menopon gallinae TaxID=328185 RepID=A0AAW2HEZ8_9NEOP
MQKELLADTEERGSKQKTPGGRVRRRGQQRRREKEVLADTEERGSSRRHQHGGKTKQQKTPEKTSEMQRKRWQTRRKEEAAEDTSKKKEIGACWKTRRKAEITRSHQYIMRLQPGSGRDGMLSYNGGYILPDGRNPVGQGKQKRPERIHTDSCRNFQETSDDFRWRLNLENASKPNPGQDSKKTKIHFKINKNGGHVDYQANRDMRSFKFEIKKEMILLVDEKWAGICK